MPNELWMIYDKTGLDRNSTFVEMFAERGKPYNIDVKAVLDTEYLSLLKKEYSHVPFLSEQSVRRSMPNLKSGRFLYGIPRLSAGSVITKERHESI